MKYVLITPSREADILFFKGVDGHEEFQTVVNTEYLADAHVFEYAEEHMQYVLDRMPSLYRYSAVPIEDIDIFKAKLKGV